MHRKLSFLITLSGFTLLASACQPIPSPATTMSPEQISQLSNQQLCELKNSYVWEQKTEVEIGKRNLNCDPDYNECLAKGIDPTTSSMGYCIKDIQEKRALEEKLEEKEAELKRKQEEIEDKQEQYERDRRHQEVMEKYKTPKYCQGFPFCRN